MLRDEMPLLKSLNKAYGAEQDFALFAVRDLCK